MRKPESCVCIVGFPACGCQKKSVVYETECRHAAVQRGKQDNIYIYIYQGSWGDQEEGDGAGPSS